MLAGYVAILQNRRLLGYAAAGGFFYSGVFAYVAGTPFAYISYHHLSPQLYGVVFAAGIIGLMAANFANSRLVTGLGSDRLLLIGTIGAAFSGVLTAIAAGTDFGGLPGLAAAQFLFVSTNGFIIANAVAGALASVPTRVGTASAVVGAVQYGSGALGSAVMGAFADGTPWPMGLVMALAGIGSFACVLIARVGKAPI